MGTQASPYNQYWDDKIRGAHNALCAFGDLAGKAAAGWPIASQTAANAVMKTKVGAAALTFGAVYATVGCSSWEAPTSEDYEPPSYGGCWKVAPGQCGVGRRFDLDDPDFGATFAPEVTEILQVVYEKPPGFTGPSNSAWVQYRTCQGNEGWSKIANDEATGKKTGVTIVGADCDPAYDFSMPRATKPDPFNYTDPESGCSMVIQVEGAYEDASGNTGPVYTIKPAEDTLRSSAGGRIYGDCGFAPVVVYEGDRVYTRPIQGDEDYDWNSDEKPWWAKLLDGLITGTGIWAGQKALDALFAKQYPPVTYELIAPCNKDEKTGKPLSRIWEIPTERWNDRVLSGLTLITEIQQQSLDWKTPVCFGHEKGTYARSITFASDENTERGNRRLTKRFGYRSDTPCELEQLYAHWRDFVWNTGPFVVRHRGSALGNLEVWAASFDEGKRVIQHAGREAGIDPNQVGEWTVSSTNSPRYGLSHTVKLMEVRGLWQATARQGPNGYAEAVWTRPDL